MTLTAQALAVVLVPVCLEVNDRFDVMSAVAASASRRGRTRVRRPFSVGPARHLLGDLVMAHSTGDRFEFLCMRQFHAVELHMAVYAPEISVNRAGEFLRIHEDRHNVPTAFPGGIWIFMAHQAVFVGLSPGGARSKERAKRNSYRHQTDGRHPTPFKIGSSHQKPLHAMEFTSARRSHRPPSVTLTCEKLLKLIKLYFLRQEINNDQFHFFKSPFLNPRYI